MVWTGVTWCRTESSSELLRTQQWTFTFYQDNLQDHLSDSDFQVWLWFMEPDICLTARIQSDLSVSCEFTTAVNIAYL